MEFLLLSSNLIGEELVVGLAELTQFGVLGGQVLTGEQNGGIGEEGESSSGFPFALQLDESGEGLCGSGTSMLVLVLHPGEEVN